MEKTEKPKSSWQERSKDIKHKLHTPFVYVEWHCERLSYRLEHWAFLDILKYVGRFSILTSIVLGVVVYVMEADERVMQAENQRKAKHYQAWQVINLAHGKPGSGGRIDALRDLNEDRVSLNGVDISNAFLPDIDLKYAKLSYANLSGADLKNANFSGAELRKTNLAGADLKIAKFSRADLQRANLSGTNLFLADIFVAQLQSANLSSAELPRARLLGANLSGANLNDANLCNTDLSEADLQGADLSRAYLRETNLWNIRNWEDIESIKFAKIFKVENPPDGFIEWAQKNDAMMIESEDQWEFMLKEERSRKKAKTPQ